MRILVICYWYPPIGGGYTERVSGYIREFIREGCDVYVACGVREAAGLPRDESRLEAVSGAKAVWHSDEWAPNGRYGGAVAKALRGAICRTAALISGPDSRVLWASTMARQLHERLQKERIDLVLTSSAPYSVHLVGWHLRQSMPGIRWVADYRDPMSTNHVHVSRAVTGLQIRRLAWWERRFNSVADAVIANTHMNGRNLIERKLCQPDKLHVFQNGYDGDSSEWDRPAFALDDKFHLLYVGGLRGAWFEGRFFELLRVMKEEWPEAYGSLAVHFIGEEASKGMERKHAGVVEDVRFEGFLSERALAKAYASANGFLLLLPESKSGLGWVPQKLYGYLRAGKPVFALIPEGEAAQYVRTTGSGIVIHPSAIREGAAALARWVEAFRAGRWQPLCRTPSEASVVAALDRRQLAKSMLREFAQLLGGATPQRNV